MGRAGHATGWPGTLIDVVQVVAGDWAAAIGAAVLLLATVACYAGERRPKIFVVDVSCIIYGKEPRPAASFTLKVAKAAAEHGTVVLVTDGTYKTTPRAPERETERKETDDERGRGRRER
jgi:hypothetical protein